jgi:hypothetical protein
MRARYRAFILSLLVPLGLSAQDIGLLRTRSHGEGVSGTASVYGGFEEGDYKPAFQASSLWKAGASASGVLHQYSSSYQGSFSFEQMNGKEMFTSMFLEPGYFPVDVLEFTPGDKTRQTYKLGGGFATELDDDFLVLGAKASYSASNYAKRKDIRHTTYGMSLRVEPTVTFKPDDNMGLSLAYVFQKRTESIDAEQVGSATDESYYAFLDKGMRYGTYQVWDGDGLHLDEAGVGVFPVREYANGFAYVLDFPAFAVGMESLWKHGTVGEKGYDWFRYPGHAFSLFFERKWTRQNLRVEMGLQDDQLEEAVLDKVSSGGVTTPQIYGYNAVSDRVSGSVDLTYGIRFPQGHLKRLQAVLHGGVWDERSYLMYPYTDDTQRYNGTLTVVAGFAFGRFDLGLRANGGIGGWKEQGLQGATEEVLSTPFRLEPDWLRKMEYFSTSKVGAGLTLTYHLKALPGFFLQAEGSWLHGFGVVLLTGAERYGATFRIGYDIH